MRQSMADHRRIRNEEDEEEEEAKTAMKTM
jgi:hypothetical protein